MKIALIGSGNVATVLGRLLSKSGHRILQVISRNITHAHILAAELGAEASDFKTQPLAEAELVIIALNDDALYNNCHHFIMQDKLVLHTAGSVSKDILQKFSDRYGVLYPLQSLRKELTAPAVPLLIDGNTTESAEQVMILAKSVSETVSYATDQQRLVLHTAAVIVSNFSNHLYALADDFCKNEEVDFSLLKPLIKETANRLEVNSPADVQTGPAIRKDIHTLDKHLRVLAPYPKLKTMYLRITDSIMNP